MSDLEERVERIEYRLARIEEMLADKAERPEAARPAPSAKPDIPGQPPASPAEFIESLGQAARQRFAAPDLSVTRILGWTGATALVLATAYLIRLAVDSGWLTPERQLALAVLSGFLLIGAGLRLRGPTGNMPVCCRRAAWWCCSCPPTAPTSTTTSSASCPRRER